MELKVSFWQQQWARKIDAFNFSESKAMFDGAKGNFPDNEQCLIIFLATEIRTYFAHYFRTRFWKNKLFLLMECSGRNSHFYSLKTKLLRIASEITWVLGVCPPMRLRYSGKEDFDSRAHPYLLDFFHVRPAGIPKELLEKAKLSGVWQPIRLLDSKISISENF